MTSWEPGRLTLEGGEGGGGRRHRLSTAGGMAGWREWLAAGRGRPHRAWAAPRLSCALARARASVFTMRMRGPLRSTSRHPAIPPASEAPRRAPGKGIITTPSVVSAHFVWPPRMFGARTAPTPPILHGGPGGTGGSPAVTGHRGKASKPPQPIHHRRRCTRRERHRSRRMSRGAEPSRVQTRHARSPRKNPTPASAAPPRTGAPHPPTQARGARRTEASPPSPYRGPVSPPVSPFVQKRYIAPTPTVRK